MDAGKKIILVLCDGEKWKTCKKLMKNNNNKEKSTKQVVFLNACTKIHKESS